MLTTGAKFGFKEDALERNEDLIDLWDDDGTDSTTIVQSPWQKSFDELRPNMVQLPDWNIYKRTIVDGTGEPLGDRRARITFHYNFFFQFSEEAFDSSFLRRTKMVTYTYDGSLLPGTLAALFTMRKGEEAQFVIGYSLMFGKMGSPPRVPPEADILMVAQMLDIEEVGDEKALDSLPDEYRKKFVCVEEKAHEVLKKAADLYKQGRFSHACRNYHSIVTSLEFCNLDNEDEQKRQRKFLIDTYTKLMQCYIKLEDYKKTCAMFNHLNAISPVELRINFQAQLYMGIALGKLGDYVKALGHLRMAQKISPHDEKVNRELIAINEKKQKSEAETKNFWRKAFRIVENRGRDDTSAKVSAGLKEKVGNFLNDDKRHNYPLGGLTKDEIKCVDEMLANRMNCQLTMNKMADGSTVCELVKEKSNAGN